MEAEEVGTNVQDKLSGFIFMCNRMTKQDCYRFRVFALPAGRKHIVEKINPGTYLFLFDTDVKLLYGIYLATSTGMLNIEPLAFGGRFPAQVKFKIYEDCLPLPENHFKHAIIDNYQKHSSKFNPELNIRQVRSLLELFRPLHELSTAPTHPVLNETSRTSLSEDSFLSRMSPDQAPRQLNYKQVNEPGEPTGCACHVNSLVPNSVAAQSVPSQASRNQIHAPASIVTPEGAYATRMVSNHTLALPDPQYTHKNILNPQPEFHSSLMNKGNGHALSLPDSQHAHLNVIHPQPEFHYSVRTMGSSYAQSLQDSQHAHLNGLHPQPEFHSSMMTMGNSYAQSHPQHAHLNVLHLQPEFHSSMRIMGSSYDQSLQHSQHAHLNVVNPQPVIHSSMMTMGSSYAQSPQDPQHPHQSIPSPLPGFHPPVANVGSSHAQMLWDPHRTDQNIPNLQPDSYSNMANMGSSYAQSLPDPQHTQQTAQNLQPGFSSSLVNMDHANVGTQSHAWSSLYHPYVPQQVTSAAYSDHQGSGAMQEVISSGQQPGMGSEYYQSSMQTQNPSTAENVVSHHY